MKKQLSEQDNFNKMLLNELINAKNKTATKHTTIFPCQTKAQIAINSFESVFNLAACDQLIKNLKQNISHNTDKYCYTMVNWSIKRINYAKL